MRTTMIVAALAALLLTCSLDAQRRGRPGPGRGGEGGPPIELRERIRERVQEMQRERGEQRGPSRQREGMRLSLIHI